LALISTLDPAPARGKIEKRNEGGERPLLPLVLLLHRSQRDKVWLEKAMSLASHPSDNFGQNMKVESYQFGRPPEGRVWPRMRQAKQSFPIRWDGVPATCHEELAPLNSPMMDQVLSHNRTVMRSELTIRRIADRRFDVHDASDPNFELSDISDTQLLGYLRNRKLLDTTAEAVLEQFDANEKRSVLHVTIDRSLGILPSG
jgi:hypothetical protein